MRRDLHVARSKDVSRVRNDRIRPLTTRTVWHTWCGHCFETSYIPNVCLENVLSLILRVLERWPLDPQRVDAMGRLEICLFLIK